jgi:hypothetical protein
MSMGEAHSDRLAGATLELRLISDLTGEFFIPRYQRGYRWGRIEVVQLLDDLIQSAGNPYCLQPIVVKRIDDQHWELVDGQQRLTTLYLLLRFMERANLQRRGPRYTMRYETREGSAAFLYESVPSRRSENIDFFHIAGAYDTIGEWFKAKGHEDQVVANDLFAYLHKSVRVIWYEASAELDATTLFTRLNVGRIPLTDAELVKALLLTSAPLERRREIAQQWDQIERELHDDELWAFVSSAKEADCPTRITLLFDALAERGATPKHARFDTFEALRDAIAKDPLVFWNRVLDLHGLLRGWFEDRSLYHKVGFLVATGETFADLVAMARDLQKSAVEARLDERIRARIDASPSDVAALSYDVDSHKEKLQRILILMNVETVRRRPGSSERYSFHLSRKQHWSLEHIHAQRAEGLNKAEQWAAWLREHRRALDAFDRPDATRLAERIDAVLAGTVERRTFDELSQEIAGLFTRDETSSASTMHSLHGISNLALLSCDDNAQLNNAVFEVKRRQILDLDRAGGFIPICTKQVFLKYFTGADAQQIHFWSVRDRESYLDAILGAGGAVTPYLRTEEGS